MRSGEVSWYECMRRAWFEVADLQYKHVCPVVIAGDITHKSGDINHKEPAELTSFIIRMFSNGTIIACAGNHDLPNHNYEEIQKSILWTLVEAKKIQLIEPNKSIEINNTRFHGFPWGTELKPLDNPHDMLIEVAICHHFVWTKDTGYEGAPEDCRLKAVKEKLKGYDVALFGDNHKFLFRPSDEEVTILNPGTFMRRTTHDLDHKPCVGLLHSDGTVTIHYLDTSKDVYLNRDEMQQRKKDKANFSDFVEGLTNIGDSEFDFPRAVKYFLDNNQVKSETKKEIIRMLQ